MSSTFYMAPQCGDIIDILMFLTCPFGPLIGGLHIIPDHPSTVFSSFLSLFWISKIVLKKLSSNWTRRSNESFSINFSIQINTVWTFWRKLNPGIWINISQYHSPPLPQSTIKATIQVEFKSICIWSLVAADPTITEEASGQNLSLTYNFPINTSTQNRYTNTNIQIQINTQIQI